MKENTGRLGPHQQGLSSLVSKQTDPLLYSSGFELFGGSNLVAKWLPQTMLDTRGFYLFGP